MSQSLLVDVTGSHSPTENVDGKQEPVPVFNESMGGALIDSARISVMAARGLLADSSPLAVSPLEDNPPTLHECLDQAMQWLDAARVQTIERGSSAPTSFHVVSR